MLQKQCALMHLISHLWMGHCNGADAGIFTPSASCVLYRMSGNFVIHAIWSETCEYSESPECPWTSCGWRMRGIPGLPTQCCIGFVFLLTHFVYKDRVENCRLRLWAESNDPERSIFSNFIQRFLLLLWFSRSLIRCLSAFTVTLIWAEMGALFPPSPF